MTPDLISRADVLAILDAYEERTAHGVDALREEIAALVAPPASPELRAWFEQLYRAREKAS